MFYQLEILRFCYDFRCEAVLNLYVSILPFHNVAGVQNQENWLDVFKVSKEALLKELEAANNRYGKKSNTPDQLANDNQEVEFLLHFVVLESIVANVNLIFLHFFLNLKIE